MALLRRARAAGEAAFQAPPCVATYTFFAGWTCLSAAPAAYQGAGQKVMGFTRTIYLK